MGNHSSQFTPDRGKFNNHQTKLRMASNGGSGGDYQAVEANETRRKRINQRAVLLSAVTIAAIVGVVLIVSLTAGLEEEYKEVWCPEDNQTCIDTLCPEGMKLKEMPTWNETLRAECIPKKSWCKETVSGESLQCCPVSIKGIAVTTWSGWIGDRSACGSRGQQPCQRYCGHNFVWVEWRKMCMRLNRTSGTE